MLEAILLQLKKRKKAHSKMDCSIWGCTDHLHSTQGQC